MATNPALKNSARWLARLLLGGVFIYAGTAKAIDPTGFVTDIQHYRLLPHPLVLAAALYFPWLEILCGLAVFSRRWERGALLILTTLCAIFCLALVSAWARGLDITCGCFGHALTTTIPLALLRSLVLTSLAAALLYWNPANARAPVSTSA
jgi:uncharacterized membrane protein YphA (DoxX/SURF4 family)